MHFTIVLSDTFAEPVADVLSIVVPLWHAAKQRQARRIDNTCFIGVCYLKISKLLHFCGCRRGGAQSRVAWYVICFEHKFHTLFYNRAIDAFRVLQEAFFVEFIVHPLFIETEFTHFVRRRILWIEVQQVDNRLLRRRHHVLLAVPHGLGFKAPEKSWTNGLVTELPERVFVPAGLLCRHTRDLDNGFGNNAVERKCGMQADIRRCTDLTGNKPREVRLLDVIRERIPSLTKRHNVAGTLPLMQVRPIESRYDCMHLVDRKTAQRMPLTIKLRVRHLCDSFQKRCKITTFLEYMQIFLHFFGHLAQICSVIWPSSIRINVLQRIPVAICIRGNTRILIC